MLTKILKVPALANKQYISITRLFEHFDIAGGDNFNLSRAKKQLQAEFGIAQSGFIEIDGYSYSRHSVFEEIEDPAFPKRLVFHQQIWENRPVLELLEKKVIDFNIIEEAFQPFSKNKEFDLFFSPYFVEPFSYLSRTYLTEANLENMGRLLSLEDFIQPAEREEAFRPLRVFLDENARLLRNVTSENYKLMRPKIVHWIDTDWHILFNNLPHEFYDVKHDIAVRLINIGVSVQKTNRRDCVQMSERLILLRDMEQNITDTINTNHSIYTRAYQPEGKASGKGVFWIVIVLISIGRIAATDSCSSKSTRYEIPKERLKIIIPESTLNKLKIKDSALFEKLNQVPELRK